MSAADPPAGAVHPSIQAMLEAEIAAGAPEPTLAEAREAYLQTAVELGGDPVAVGSVADHAVSRPDGGSVAVRVYRPLEPPPEPAGALVWCHGGGWVLGNLDGFDRVARRLANASGAVCVSVDYRLAPEAPFPAAIQDADAVVAWVTGPGAADLDVDPRRVAVGGDSAGGQVAAVAALHARDRLAAQLLVYPALDPATAGPAYAQYADGPMLTTAAMQAFWETYRAGHRADDPDLDVALADLAGAPPAWIATAAHDPLRDDGRRYGALLEAAGVPVASRTFPTMTHGFLRWGGIVDEAHELIGWLGAALAP